MKFGIVLEFAVFASYLWLIIVIFNAGSGRNGWFLFKKIKQ